MLNFLFSVVNIKVALPSTALYSPLRRDIYFSNGIWMLGAKAGCARASGKSREAQFYGIKQYYFFISSPPHSPHPSNGRYSGRRLGD
jgi:hypothetical protein